MGNEHSHRHHECKESLDNLPIEIVLPINSSGHWVKYKGTRGDEIHFQNLTPKTEEYRKAKELIEKYLTPIKDLKITKLSVLRNEHQINEFYKKWASSTNAPTFQQNTDTKDHQMQHSINAYQSILDKCAFNTDKFANPIILTAHGLEQLYSFEIGYESSKEGRGMKWRYNY
jgi:hypothetical protein